MAKVTTFKLSLISSLLVFTSYAYSGDDPVNCRNETAQVPVYSGNATCYAGSGVWISRYVSDQNSPTAILSRTQYLNGQWRTFSCSASVPFSHYQNLTTQVCDYTPDADFRVSVNYDGTAYTATARASSRASDRDGSIVQHSWTVNGVSYGSSAPVISATTFTRLSINYTVTDNDGYTDSKTRVVYLDPGDDPCLEGEVSC